MIDLPAQTFRVRLFVADSYEADIEARTEAEAHEKARARLRKGRGEGFATGGAQFMIDPDRENLARASFRICPLFSRDEP